MYVDPFIVVEEYLRNFADTAYQYLVVEQGFYYIAAKTFTTLLTISLPLSVAVLLAIIYCVERLKSIRRQEAKLLEVTVVPAFDEKTPGDKVLNDKWAKVLTHVDSPSSNDWLLAIIEADIILAEILEKMGYQGDTIGEKLKRVEKSDFETLDQAWEAHKVRNAIAHQSNFSISQREAKRVIGLYRQVFEEFYYI